MTDVDAANDDGSPSEIQLAARAERTEAGLRAMTETELEVRDRCVAMLESIRDGPADGPDAEALSPALMEAGRDLLPLIADRIQFLREEAPDVAAMCRDIHLNHTDSSARASELAWVTEATAACAAALDALLRLLWEIHHRTSHRGT